MLTRRTNVLFTEEDYQMLKNLSKKTGKTIGELIRYAVWKVYGLGKKK